jgi:hypothetical protein
VYRVMAEKKAGATSFSWSIVDGSFIPDAGALTATADDVDHPWTAATAVNLTGRFRAKGAKSWTTKVRTPLDGLFELRLTMPGGALYDATVLSSDGRTVLAKSLWSGTGEKKAAMQLCGQRSVVVRVVRHGLPGLFRVALTRP